MHLAPPDGFCAAEVSPNGKRVRVSRYSREIEVKAGAKLVKLRQDLYLRQLLRGNGRPTWDAPKICKIRTLAADDRPNAPPKARHACLAGLCHTATTLAVPTLNPWLD